MALGLFLFALPASSQDAAPANGGSAAPSPAPSSEPEILPIAVEQIGVESEKQKRQIAEALASQEPTEAIAAVTAEIPERAADVERLLAVSNELLSRDPNLVEVDQIRQEWRALLEQLDEMQDELGERASYIGRMRDSLEEKREIWLLTAEAAAEAGEEASVQKQISAVLAQVDAALDAAKARQGEVSSLQSEVAGLSEAARADIGQLMKVRRTLVGRVFERDRIPMWEPAFFEILTFEEVRDRLKDHWGREVAALSRFADQHRERLIVHFIGTLALCAFTVAARRRIRRFHDQVDDADDDPALDHMDAVFEHPIALAFLLSLFVGLWGYREIPPLAAPVVGATALLPAVVILRGLVPPPVRPVLYVLLALYFIGRLNEAVAPLPGLPRLVFIAEMAVFLSLVMWWRRPARLKDVPASLRGSAPFRWLAFGLRLAVFAAPAAILAEIAGYTALARLLGGTLLTAGYAGMMLYGSVVATDGLVAFLLRVRPLAMTGMAQRHRLLVAHYVERIVRWLAVGLFVWVLLVRLEIVDTVWEAIVTIWDFAIPLIAIQITVGSIIEFIVIVRLTFLAARFIEFMLDEEVYTRVRMAKGQPYAVSTLTRYMVLFAGFMLAIFALGIDVNRFTILAGAFGVGIGFGLQTVVNNFVSGIILLTEQPVQVGDTIELEGVFGEVQRIGIRSSTVRTWQGAEVIVPNAQLVSEQVTNWTLSDDRRRIEVPIGVAYGTDPERVIAILEQVASGHEHVLVDPAPLALFTAFGDSALEFELRCWTDLTGRYMQIRSQIAVAVDHALADAGITIPFPQRDLHIASVRPAAVDGLARLSEAHGQADGVTAADAAREGEGGGEGAAGRDAPRRSAPRGSQAPSAAWDGDEGDME